MNCCKPLNGTYTLRLWERYLVNRCSVCESITWIGKQGGGIAPNLSTDTEKGASK